MHWQHFNVKGIEPKGMLRPNFKTIRLHDAAHTGQGMEKKKNAYMLSHAKVSKFDFTIRADKYVSTFNISAKRNRMKWLRYFFYYQRNVKQLWIICTTCGQCSSHASRQDQREFVQCNYGSQVP